MDVTRVYTNSSSHVKLAKLANLPYGHASEEGIREPDLEKEQPNCDAVKAWNDNLQAFYDDDVKKAAN